MVSYFVELNNEVFNFVYAVLRDVTLTTQTVPTGLAYAVVSLVDSIAVGAVVAIVFVLLKRLVDFVVGGKW